MNMKNTVLDSKYFIVLHDNLLYIICFSFNQLSLIVPITMNKSKFC